MMDRSISVVITAHNEARGITECLLSIAAQSELPAKYEIILVDDRSSDGTAETALALSLPNLRLFRLQPHNDSPLTTRQQALDLGMQAARFDTVLILDADTIVPSTWVKNLCSPIWEKQADAVAGLVQFRGGHPLIRAWQNADAVFYLNVCRMLNGLGLDAGIFFGSFAVRRDVWFEIGGFQTLGFALTEDLTFARALLARGRTLRYVFHPAGTVEACHSLAELAIRARRVSAGALRPLGIVIAAWMALFIGLVMTSIVVPLPWVLAAFVLRWVLGIASIAGPVRKKQRIELLAIAPFYDALSILLAIRVAAGLWREPWVVWGGTRYAR